MALSVHTTGAAAIKVDSGVGDALEQIGFSAEGVTIREEAYFLDVPGDQNGGSDGPPIDVQYMGEVHTIIFDLTLWDETVVDKVRPRVKGGTAGTISTPGSLMYTNGFRLLIDPDSEPRNYPICFPREPIEMNKGTKYSRVAMVWTAYKDLTTGLMWDTTTA